MTRTFAELTADSKIVYNGSLDDLVALASKYAVSTKSLRYAQAYPSDTFASIGTQAFGTKSTLNEIRSKLYATIKSEMRKANERHAGATAAHGHE